MYYGTNITQTAVTNVMEQRMLLIFKQNVSYVTTYIFRSDR